MADTPTIRKRLRKQSLGSNLNSWGDTKLNEVLDAIDQCMDGYESIALTGDLTLTTTNYTTADQAKYRVINFTGSAGAVAVTFPSVEGWYLILNNNSGVVTCKCSGGTGVAVPAGYIALIYGNGTDMANGAPMLVPGAMTVAGQIHGVTAGTSGTDAVNVTQMGAAIATAALPATAGTILNSVNDRTANYLSQKIAVSGLSVSTQNPGANETLLITADHKILNSAADTTADYLSQKVAASVSSSYAAISSSVGTVNPGGNEQTQIAITYDGGQAILGADILSPF